MASKDCLRPGCKTQISEVQAFCRPHFDQLPHEVKRGLMEAQNRRDKIAFLHMSTAGLKFFNERESV
jgi:hypothetical protein